jgi:predicted  nucleic acid-binding Zn-ribbon protein
VYNYSVGIHPQRKYTHKLQAAETRFLRSVKGRTRLDKIRNEDIRKELRVFSINDRIRRYRQDSLEHVERMEEGRVPKQALWYRTKGRRDPDRPRRRWNS